MAKLRETTFVTYVEHSDGIWEGKYKDGIPVITLELAAQVVQERLNLQKGDDIRLTLWVPKDRGLISPEAQSYFAGPKGTQGLIAVGLLVDGPLDWLIIKFLLMVKPSSFPVNTFMDLEAASKWLLKQGGQLSGSLA
jgi:hypothetical protein